MPGAVLFQLNCSTSGQAEACPYTKPLHKDKRQAPTQRQEKSPYAKKSPYTKLERPYVACGMYSASSHSRSAGVSFSPSFNRRTNLSMSSFALSLRQFLMNPS